MASESKASPPLSEQQVLEELKKHGITTIHELARNIAVQSASKAELNAAKAKFDQARGIPVTEEADYVWTGKNYSVYHPEPEPEPGPACW